MKKIILLLSFIISFSNYAFASKNCFIAKENGKILKMEGDCDTAYGPQSSFKIALSLMGFDSGILKTKNNPAWPIPPRKISYTEKCKAVQDPQSWIKNSCLWYSEVLADKIGEKKFQEYMTKFSYGNQDISAGVNNACWVSSSLKISPKGQVEFIQKFLDHELSISDESYEKTENILFVKEIADGWKVFGKTGTGDQFDQNGKQIKLQHGWFVGYMVKDNRKIIFVHHLVDDEIKPRVSNRAKLQALDQKLPNIIKKLGKLAKSH